MCLLLVCIQLQKCTTHNLKHHNIVHYGIMGGMFTFWSRLPGAGKPISDPSTNHLKNLKNQFGIRFGRPLIFLAFCHFYTFQNLRNSLKNPQNPCKINTLPNLPKKINFYKEITHQIYSKITS